MYELLSSQTLANYDPVAEAFKVPPLTACVNTSHHSTPSLLSLPPSLSSALPSSPLPLSCTIHQGRVQWMWRCYVVSSFSSD